MRLSRKITTYGKELYNWNFFKVNKGYEVNPNGSWADTSIRVGFGWFDDDANSAASRNPISDLEIYILKADAFTPECIPYYYHRTGPATDSTPDWPNLTWGDPNLKAKIKRDYDKICDNYLYKIKIYNHTNLMIINKRDDEGNLISGGPWPISDLILPSEHDSYYKIFVCTTEKLINVPYGCGGTDEPTYPDGWYYNVYSNTIFVRRDTDTYNCFRGLSSSANDHELQMLSYSNEIQYIPSKELIDYNIFKKENNYTGRIPYTLSTGEEIYVTAARTEPNTSWFYAYNIYPAVIPDPEGILGGNTNANINDNTTLNDLFIKWFTVTINNKNAPFYIDLKLNGLQYQFINGVTHEQLCTKTEDDVRVAPGFKNDGNPTIKQHRGSSGNPGVDMYTNCFCTFKDGSENTRLPCYSTFLRNELIPITDTYSNCTVEIHNKVYSNHIQPSNYPNDNYYNASKNYEAQNFEFSKIIGLIGDDNFDDYRVTAGCFLMFKYFDDGHIIGDKQIEVYVMATNPEGQNHQKIPGLEISNYSIDKNGFFDSNNNNGKIEDNDIYSPVNYQIIGEKNNPPEEEELSEEETPINNENGGN